MIQYIEKYSAALYYTFGLVCLGFFLFQRIDGCSLKIGHACPELLLIAVVAAGLFFREWTGFWFGLFCGIALDTVAASSRCFYSFALMTVGFLSGFAFHFLLNRNIKSAMLAGTFFSILFFSSSWFFLCFLKGDPSALQMYLTYYLPSAIYTAVFMLPFFYFVRWLAKRNILEK